VRAVMQDMRWAVKERFGDVFTRLRLAAVLP
jgi:hypothetical protein